MKERNRERERDRNTGDNNIAKPARGMQITRGVNVFKSTSNLQGAVCFTDG